MIIQHEYLVRTVVSVEEPCSPKKLDNSFLLNIFSKSRSCAAVAFCWAHSPKMLDISVFVKVAPYWILYWWRERVFACRTEAVFVTYLLEGMLFSSPILSSVASC